LCLDGPKNTLDQTLFCQPAVLVTSLACLEKLKATNPQVIDTCIATAGFSVGEIAALVFAGCLTFENGMLGMLFHLFLSIWSNNDFYLLKLLNW